MTTPRQDFDGTLRSFAHRAQSFIWDGYQNAVSRAAALRHPDGRVLSIDPAIHEVMLQQASNFVSFRRLQQRQRSRVRDASFSAILAGYQLARSTLGTFNSIR